MWHWLLKIDSMGRSFGAYAPIVAVDKLITTARVIVLTWVVGTFELGVWFLGVLVFSVLAPVATLGASDSVARYVSYYQQRGQLGDFFRRARLGVLAVAGLATLAAAAACVPTAWALAGVGEVRLDFDRRLVVAALALANAVLMSLYHNLQAFCRGLRVFRLLAAMDLAYAVLFSGLAVAAGLVYASGYAILAAHAVSLGVMLVVGDLAAAKAVACSTGILPVGPTAVPAVENAEAPTGGTPAAAGETPVILTGKMPVLRRLLGFGLAAMAATVIWSVCNQVSAWWVNRYLGAADVGIYATFRQLCQPVWVLSGVLWGVLLGHVARDWEAGRGDEARRLMNLTYKAGTLGLTTLSVLLLVTSPWWIVALRPEYRPHLPLLAGLMVFYQGSANLGLAGMAARLREQPLALAGLVLLAAAVNVALAPAWVARHGLQGAAWAAAAGMMCACAAGVVYLLAGRLRLDGANHVLALSPAVLLLPGYWPGVAWAAVLAVAAATPLILSRDEKVRLLRGLRWGR